MLSGRNARSASNVSTTGGHEATLHSSHAGAAREEQTSHSQRTRSPRAGRADWWTYPEPIVPRSSIPQRTDGHQGSAVRALEEEHGPGSGKERRAKEGSNHPRRSLRVREASAVSEERDHYRSTSTVGGRFSTASRHRFEESVRRRERSRDEGTPGGGEGAHRPWGAGTRE